jgi:hypothetical protein
MEAAGDEPARGGRFASQYDDFDNLLIIRGLCASCDQAELMHVDFVMMIWEKSADLESYRQTAHFPLIRFRFIFTRMDRFKKASARKQNKSIAAIILVYIIQTRLLTGTVSF